MIEFYNTQMGRRFFESIMPDMASALSDIAAAMKQHPKGKTILEMAYPDCHMGSTYLVDQRTTTLRNFIRANSQDEGQISLPDLLNVIYLPVGCKMKCGNILIERVS